MEVREKRGEAGMQKEPLKAANNRDTMHNGGKVRAGRRQVFPAQSRCEYQSISDGCRGLVGVTAFLPARLN